MSNDTQNVRVNETTGGTFVWPTGEPINMIGEADAYAGETYENAFQRLHYCGCQCGFMVDQVARDDGLWVTVYNGPRPFRLRFENETSPLDRIEIETVYNSGVWRPYWNRH